MGSGKAAGFGAREEASSLLYYTHSPIENGQNYIFPIVFILMKQLIDFLYFILAETQTKLIAFLGEQYLSNGISLIMGILGTIAFFMQKQKKIKPIVMQNGDITFNVTEKNVNDNYLVYLNSVELYLTISNLKNAIGIMEDVFVRIYPTGTYQPETVIYFANKKKIEDKESEFTPFIISPNSHISIKIEFGQVEHNRSEKIITLEKHYALDVFYKINGIRKPIMLKTIFTYNLGKIENNKLELKNLSIIAERDKYYKVKNKIYKSTYKGIINFYLNNRLHKIKRYIFYIPKRYLFGLFETIFYFLKFVITNIISFVISKKIIIREGRKIANPNIHVGNEQHRVLNDKTINKLFTHIERIIEEMNEELLDDNKILITRQDNKLVLTRFLRKLEIYQPGDSSICIHIGKGENIINLRFEIKESKWGIKYWSYEGKFITQYNMAIKILNYFTLYALIQF